MNTELLLPLAERYVRFRETVFSGLEESPPLAGWAEPMTELHLQSRWFAGEFGSHFTTVCGRSVMVRDFGIWNHGAGPDFNACTVLIDGQQVTGDIELDPDVRDWERHQHGANPDYQRVVLHLYLYAPQEGRFYTRDVGHREVPQVVLTPAMLDDGSQTSGALAEARLGRCAVPLSAMSHGRVQSLIEAAAQYRLARKSRRLHQWVAAHGREQTAYQALAETLGYKANAQPFLVLAQRLPLRRLLAMQAEEREALLFGAAGFLDATPFDDKGDDTRAYLRGLWAQWWKQRDEFTRWIVPPANLHWSLRAVRPGNHPQRRVAALAAMLAVWPAIYRGLKNAEAWDCEAWCEVFTKLSHDYWARHYTLTAEAAAKPVAMVGETRVQEMLANVVYPLLVPDRPLLWAEYLDLPAMLENQKAKRASLRLFGDGSALAAVFKKKLHHQQGLVQLYEDFCLVDDSACADCPFPERIKQWAE